MAERTTELTTFAKILLAGIAGVVVLGGLGLAAGAFFGDNSNTDLVILKAETEPVKKAPLDKGGRKINSLDSPVLSLLDKAKEIEDGVEILRPPISDPEPPPIDVTEDDTSTEAASGEATSEETTQAETAPVATAQAETPPVETPQQETPQQATTQAEIEVIEDTASTATDADTTADTTTGTTTGTTTDRAEEPPKDEITAAIDSMPQKRPNTPKIVATIDVNSPSYVVQFAAFKSETRARNTAAVLSTKHKSRLDGMALGYMRWGDYWRVVAEPMPRADANSFCSKFRSVGQECIIKLMENPNG